jgi:hypothetical protein
MFVERHELGVAAVLRECRWVCDACASDCEAALAEDPSYTSPGTDPYSQRHLALVTCASVCTLVAASMAEPSAHRFEMAEWAAEVCEAYLDLQEDGDKSDMFIQESCLRCARTCRELVALRLDVQR